MADTCTNTRRSYCKGVRRGPQFGLWMWYIVIKCIISLPCIFSSCQNVNISVSLHPDGQVNLLYGQPLELFCVAEQYTADDIEFYFGGKRIESEKVNSTTRRLYIENLKKQSLTYYCKNTATDKRCTSKILIDGPPSNVTDFSCISRNLEELNCTWSKVGNLSSTNYTLVLWTNNVPSIPCSLIHSDDEKWLCSLNTTSRPRYQQMDDVFHFQLTTCNIFGCNQQNFTINHLTIVKPDKIKNLAVINKEPHSVTLKWSIPSNMADFITCSIIHRIEYQIAKIDNTSYFRTVDTSDLISKTNKYKDTNSLWYTYTLKNLPYAHKSYEVRIYIRLELATEDRFWSDFSFEMFTTASEIPQRPPETTIGAFSQSLYTNHRYIHVYWKQLEEYEEAGANFTYKVVVTQGKKNPQTILADTNKSLSYVELDHASFDAIDISICSMNAVGSSVNRSHLYIPAKQDTETLKVNSFTKLAYENGTYKLSWVHTDNIDNYTLFWCYHNVSQVCSDPMNFTVLAPTKDSYVINLPREHRYQFAISANRGYKTSGMAWAICDISKDTLHMYGIPVELHHDAAGKSHVRLTWTLDCTLQPGIITGYEISYCPVVNTTSDCVSPNNLIRNINNPKQMAVNITDLKPYTTYQFLLAINTIYGVKKIKNASTSVTTTEDTPTSPRNVIISDVQATSLNVSWDPPIQENGIIGNYVILDNRQQIHVEKIPDKEKFVTRRPVRVSGLKPYTNYTIQVIACNTGINSCSVPSPPEGIFVRTRIGPPSMLKTPLVKISAGLLKWEPPEFPGGTVDRYEIRRVKDESSNETFNTTELQYPIIHCEGVENSEYYQVRAVNLDTDLYHGVLQDSVNVILPEKLSKPQEFYGEWSDQTTVKCKSRDGITMTLILMAVFALIGLLYGSIKLVKIVRKMEDIDPVLPNGLGIPEKDISKYAFGGLYSTNKDDKPSSDEVLLLPSRTTVSTIENKENADNNCGSSDHTDSTALSDTSRGPIERHASTSDDGSDSSLHLEVEPVRIDDNNASQDEEELSVSNSETDNSRESTPDFSEKGFKKNPSGYVQSMIKPTSGYVQSAAVPHNNSLAKPATQPASSSYVMAALSPPIFTTGVAPPKIQNGPPASSAYVRPEDVQARSMMNFPKLGPSPTKVFGSESLPTMPTLPQPVKHGADSSYIQLQSLDALTSHKQPVRSAVPLQPPVSSGYVSPGDAVINKHLNNMLSGGQLVEEPAILDPTMSPDAYCRFSWSTDPANDNLHSLLTDAHTLKSSKN